MIVIFLFALGILCLLPSSGYCELTDEQGRPEDTTSYEEGYNKGYEDGVNQKTARDSNPAEDGYVTNAERGYLAGFEDGSQGLPNRATSQSTASSKDEKKNSSDSNTTSTSPSGNTSPTTASSFGGGSGSGSGYTPTTGTTWSGGGTTTPAYTSGSGGSSSYSGSSGSSGSSGYSGGTGGYVASSGSYSTPHYLYGAATGGSSSNLVASSTDDDSGSTGTTPQTDSSTTMTPEPETPAIPEKVQAVMDSLSSGGYVGTAAAAYANNAGRAAGSADASAGKPNAVIDMLLGLYRDGMLESFYPYNALRAYYAGYLSSYYDMKDTSSRTGASTSSSDFTYQQGHDMGYSDGYAKAPSATHHSSETGNTFWGGYNKGYEEGVAAHPGAIASTRYPSWQAYIQGYDDAAQDFTYNDTKTTSADQVAKQGYHDGFFGAKAGYDLGYKQGLADKQAGKTAAVDSVSSSTDISAYWNGYHAGYGDATTGLTGPNTADYKAGLKQGLADGFADVSPTIKPDDGHTNNYYLGYYEGYLEGHINKALGLSSNDEEKTPAQQMRVKGYRDHFYALEAVIQGTNDSTLAYAYQNGYGDSAEDTRALINGAGVAYSDYATKHLPYEDANASAGGNLYKLAYTKVYIEIPNRDLDMEQARRAGDSDASSGRPMIDFSTHPEYSQTYIQYYINAFRCGCVAMRNYIHYR